MAVDNARSNYAEDRSIHFKHHVPADIGPPSMPTVQDYVHKEKSKQMSLIRDWYLEGKQESAEGDPSVNRTSFTASRRFSAPSPVQELDHYKGYLIGATAIAAVVGVVTTFVHF